MGKYSVCCRSLGKKVMKVEWELLRQQHENKDPPSQASLVQAAGARQMVGGEIFFLYWIFPRYCAEMSRSDLV